MLGWPLLLNESVADYQSRCRNGGFSFVIIISVVINPIPPKASKYFRITSSNKYNLNSFVNFYKKLPDNSVVIDLLLTSDRF